VNPLIKKEIRLLLPAWIVAMVLAVLSALHATSRTGLSRTGLAYPFFSTFLIGILLLGVAPFHRVALATNRTPPDLAGQNHNAGGRIYHHLACSGDFGLGANLFRFPVRRMVLYAWQPKRRSYSANPFAGCFPGLGIFDAFRHCGF
jgi:hypothetical protein